MKTGSADSDNAIRILHLSDFHFDHERAWDAVLLLRDLPPAIGQFVREGLAPDFVAITGDVANKGRKQDYAAADKWITDRLLPVLPESFSREQILIVPGNHDVDRETVKNSRTARALQSDLLRDHSQDAVAEVLSKADERGNLLKRHEEYLKFAKAFGPAAKDVDVPWWSHVAEVRGTRVRFIGLCSSWASWSDDDQGRLLIGRWQVNTLLAEGGDADLHVALVHHPWFFLAEFDSRDVEPVMRRETDLVLRGHLHAQESKMTFDPDTACAELAAGCVYDGSQFPNSFQLVELLPGSREVRIHYRLWRNGQWIADRNAYQESPDGVATLSLDRPKKAPRQAKARAKRAKAPTRPTSADPTQYLLWLQNRTAYIDIRGLEVGSGRANRFPIDELYVPLTTSGPPPTEKPDKRGKPQDPECPTGPEGRRIELDEAIAAGRLVVIGDPGSGKSTFLNHAANLLCRKALGGTISPVLDKAVGKAAFPILIKADLLCDYLRLAEKDGRAPSHKDSPCWIAHYAGSFCRENNLGLNEDFFTRRLDGGQAAVLIDGLDEAPTDRQREHVVALVQGAAERYKDCRFVVTTRPAAYGGRTVLGDFAETRIDSLDDGAIDEFISRWCLGLFHDDPDQAQRHKEGLIHGLRARADIRRLARNPVMLTALAVVHWNEKRLPEQRADLYESVIKWLSQSRQTRPGRPKPELCVTLLQELALAMQAHPKGRQVEVPRYWAAQTIAPEWRDQPKKDRRIALADRFLQDEEIDSGIVVKRGDNVRFWHLTFQEYLAARALAGKDEQRARILRRPGLYKPEWREVVLLMAGVLYHQGIGRVDSMFSALLHRLGKKPSLEAQASCVGLLGSAIQDLSPFGYKPKDERFAATLERVQGIFDAKKAANIHIKTAIAAAEALGQSGDARFADHLAPLLDIDHKHWVPIPAGKFWMGAQKEDAKAHNYDSEAFDEESPVHEVQLSEYRIGRYPVTVCEYRRFVEEEGYKRMEFRRAGGAGTVTEPREWEEQLEHPTRPVVSVSWHEAAAYAAWATSIMRSHVKGATVVLPTEAQWERAARGTEGRKYPWGDQNADPSLMNYSESGIGQPTPVGVHPRGATPEGVCDLAGNVWEWCSDEFADYLANAKNQDPRRPASGRPRVLRGGCWYYAPLLCRPAFRDRGSPDYRGLSIGFRVAVDLK